MKKITLFFLALCAMTDAAWADGASEALLGRVAARLKVMGAYEVRFTASADGMGSVDGRYTVSGDRYRISVRGQIQFSDGRSRYEIYEDEKEVVIDAVDLASHNILVNPTRAFDFAAEDFDSRIGGREKIGGKDAQTVMLTPRRQGSGIGTIRLWVDAGSALPVRLEYMYQGESVVIDILSVGRAADADPAMFVFDPDDYAGYEIIDFR